MQLELQQSPDATTVIVPGSAAARRRALWTFVGFTLAFLGIAGLNPGTEIPLAFRVGCVAAGLLLGMAAVATYAKYGARMSETRFTFTSSGRAVVVGARGNVLEDAVVSRSHIELRTAPAHAHRHWLVWQGGRVALALSEQDSAALERLGVRRGTRPPPRPAKSSAGRVALWAFAALGVLTLPILAIYQRLSLTAGP